MTDPPLQGWDILHSLIVELQTRKAKGIAPTTPLSLPLTGAEIGVSRGWTSEHLLRAFPTLTLYLIDWWGHPEATSVYAKSGDGHAKLTLAEQQEHRLQAEQRTLFAKERRFVWASDSVKAAEAMLSGHLDFAFIDGDHTYPGVRRDLEAWYPKVRAGGLVLMHDIDHPRDRRGLWGVRKAAEEFCQERGVTLTVNSKATLGWFWKG